MILIKSMGCNKNADLQRICNFFREEVPDLLLLCIVIIGH